jgi:hypothetical protein
MARGDKKQFESGERLRVAAEAGDPAAMWRYALAELNIAPPAAEGYHNALPFLVRVTKTLRDFGDHQTSDLISRAAEAGHTQAMVVVAELTEQSDPAATERWLIRAAGLGDTAAMLYLGAMLEPHDRAGAVHWFTQLAETGDAAGMYRVYKLLRTDGAAEAAQGWLVRAAQGGNLKAQSDLGVQAFEAGSVVDPASPGPRDPRRSGVFRGNLVTRHKERLAADCVTCAITTVQDHYEVVIDDFPGGRGHRHPLQFRVCAVCGCQYPMDEDARRYVGSKGGEFFNPAKLAH